MKKLTVLLAAALVLALAAPSFAAVEFGGKLATEFKLHDVAGTWKVDGTTGLDIETAVKAEGGDPVKAVVQLKPWRFNSGFDDDGNPVDPFENPPSGIVLQDLSIDKAWIETEGAYWNGGPAVQTRLGDVKVNWNDYVAHLSDKRGITVQGMELGPVAAKSFYAWDGADRPYGIVADGSVEGVNLSGTLVRKGAQNNIALGAGTEIMPGTSVNAVLALDDANRRLYKVSADAEGLVPGVKLSASYRGADDAFAPMYTIAAEDEDGNVVGRNDRDNVNYDLLDGFNVAAETTQSGVHLKASYDDPQKLAEIAADTEIQGVKLAGDTTLVNSAVEETNLSVSKDLMLAGFDVTGKYIAKIVPGNDIEHTVKASTTTSVIPQLQDLGLSAKVKLVGGATSWNAAADYAAPNGINLGAEYDSVDGASATAGVTVEF